MVLQELLQKTGPSQKKNLFSRCADLHQHSECTEKWIWKEKKKLYDNAVKYCEEFRSLGSRTCCRVTRTLLVLLSLCFLFICWRDVYARQRCDPTRLLGHASISSNICWWISHFQSVIAEKTPTHLMKIWTTALLQLMDVWSGSRNSKKRWYKFSGFSETADKSVHHATRFQLFIWISNSFSNVLFQPEHTSCGEVTKILI